MNLKLDLLNAIHEKSVFCTPSEVAEIIYSKPDWDGRTDYDKKKGARTMTAHLNEMATLGYITKINMPGVATFYGLSKWVEGLFPKDEHLSDKIKHFKCDFQLSIKPPRKNDAD